MLVVRTLPLPTSNVWYLAYGSNLSASKFIHDRGITPLSTAVVTIPGWTLVMDSAGTPYSEPSFASISPIYGSTREKSVQLIGTAYKLTPDMYAKVISSEGGGIAYAEVEVRAELMTQEGSEGCEFGTKTFATRSLVTVLPRMARPSVRYMGLLRTGAANSNMPISYQKFLASVPVYRPPEKPTARIGAWLFLAIWVPIMSAMEKITKANLKNSESGNASFWVIAMVRAVVFAMWFYHDYFHAPIWGRGDGM
ncbi:hypothetical protein F4805DRAFT_172422 [Annulohypoxylon moriforme]|nr:hypothetical protein F4805DRAFT_172422 [Annulohypoxylon moriforme]